MNMMMRTVALAFATLALAAGVCSAQTAPKGLQMPNGTIEAAPAGTVSWELLQQAKTVQRADKKFGPESLVEVVCDTPVEFTMEPIVVAGRLAVLENDVVYYRLTNASAVQP